MKIQGVYSIDGMEDGHMRIDEIKEESVELQDLLRDMPEEIMEQCRIKHIPPNVNILHKAETMKHVYILCEGECDVLAEFKEGYLYVFGKAKGFQLIGEQEVLAGETESAATVRTKTACRFLRVTTEDFWEWIQHDPHAAIILLKVLARRLHAASSRAGERIYFPSIYLLKKFLLKEYAEADQENLRINQTRQQIADSLGISLRSVQRGVDDLKQNKLIRVAKGKIEIDRAEYQQVLDTMEE
jgi:CRP/FNR family cyclic AMP-dependent transcriptional regulator